MYNTAVIIVTYNPEIQQLNKTIFSIIDQVMYCIIIDNGNTVFNYLNNKIIIDNLGKNYGIAYAQNKGIEIARKNKIDFILLSDQDTIYSNDYIVKMLSFYNNYHYKYNIGAIVPKIYDNNKKCIRNIAIRKFEHILPKNNIIYKVAHEISSGTFIPIKSLDEIGNMKEELFIDWVDFEWCWRATSLNFDIISIPDLTIEHIIGDNVLRFGHKKYTLRSKVRYYYMIRNGIYIIFHLKILNLYESISFCIDLTKKCFGILLVEKKAGSLLMKAIYDGLRKNMYEYK